MGSVFGRDLEATHEKCMLQLHLNHLYHKEVKQRYFKVLVNKQWKLALIRSANNVNLELGDFGSQDVAVMIQYLCTS